MKSIKAKPQVPVPVAGSEVRRLLHQLNQPLSAISNYAQAGCSLIDNGLDDTRQLKELFTKIVAQCVRTTALSHELGKAVSALAPEEKQH